MMGQYTVQNDRWLILKSFHFPGYQTLNSDKHFTPLDRPKLPVIQFSLKKIIHNKSQNNKFKTFYYLNNAKNMIYHNKISYNI